MMKVYELSGMAREWDGGLRGLRWELNLSRIEIELVNGTGLEVN